MDWKKFIKDNLINEKGCLYGFATHSKKINERFPQILNLMEMMKEQTSFLPVDSPNIERIYCLYHDIGLTLCSVCKDKKAEFKGFKCGYRKVCSRECYLKYLHVIQDDGLSIVQRRAVIVLPKQKIFLSKVGEDGLNHYQRNAIKGLEKRFRIDDMGTCQDQRGKIKAVETMNKIGPDGLTLKQKATQKMIITKSIVGDDGLTIAQRTAIKVEKTKTTIGPDGLDGYQRTVLNKFHKNCQIEMFDERLYFQGGNEKAFLYKLRDLNILHLIDNSTCLKYIDIDKQRSYRPDFIYRKLKIIFEVKSLWTYEKEISIPIYKKNDYLQQEGLRLRIQNNSKWLSVLKQGYRMVIVLNKKFLFELFLEDFVDMGKSVLKQDLLTDERLIEFFK